MSNAPSISEAIRVLGRPEIERRPLGVLPLAAIIAACGAIYGAVMGTYQLDTTTRALLPLYGAIKVPMLAAATVVVCAPAFFTLNTVLRLRPDLPAAMRAILASQAAVMAALASLAPLTRFAYACGIDHRQAVLFNALMFTLATIAGQVVLIRRYRPLLARNPRHRLTLWSWLLLYAFVGIQMGWMLRPFIGTPGKPVTFLRDEPLSNAYVVVARMILGL